MPFRHHNTEMGRYEPRTELHLSAVIPGPPFTHHHSIVPRIKDKFSFFLVREALEVAYSFCIR